MNQVSLTRAQLLLAAPAALGAAVAATIALLLILPQWRQVQVARNRVAELQGLEAQLPLLTRQLEREAQGVETAQRQQAVVLQLIAGSGTIATFMAQVDRLASASGVKLSLFEPLSAAAVAAKADQAKPAQAKPGEKPEPPPAGADPLLSPGVSKQEQLVSASGPYPALLTFMRQLEKLNVLVVQRNLQLSVEDQKTQPAPGQPVPVQPVQLKVSVATYFRSAP